MENEDEYYNANEISQDEEYIELFEDQLAKNEPQEKTHQLEDTELSSELRKFQISLCEEIIQKPKAGKELGEGGYFDYVFSICRKYISQYFERNPEYQATLIMELENFIFLFQSQEGPESQALDIIIIHIKHLKSEFLKNKIDMEKARNVYAIDKILVPLERAKLWQKDTNNHKGKDISENDVRLPLKEIGDSVNSLFRSTKENKLEKCTGLMAELDRLRISPYWEESVYHYRLIYKELLWIKQQSYPISKLSGYNNDIFKQAVEACNVLITRKILSRFDERIFEERIIDAGYFDRRINDIYKVVEIQSGILDSEASLYKDLCTILRILRKLFNENLKKETFIICIDLLCEPVHKKCKEYFTKLQGDNPNQEELLVTFQWLQKIHCLLDEVRHCFQDRERDQKDIQHEIKNSNIESWEEKAFQNWFKLWNAKIPLKELAREDYQEIFRDLERIIGDILEECIYAKSAELVERAFNIKEMCEILLIQVQVEESQIDLKTLKRREIAKTHQRRYYKA